MFDYSILSKEFDEIIEKRNKIKEQYKTLEIKLSNMKSKYSSLIQNNQKKIFIYCLDSFFFQYKILLLELEHYDKVNKSVLNRMYGDYYKLFIGIVENCQKTAFEIEGLTNMENIPPYKDIDAKVEYKTEDLIKLHTSILAILNQLSTHYADRNANIKSQDEASNIGFSITSFLDTLGYENRLLYEQINLYNSYLQFYHSSQNGYLDKILGKMETFMTDIDKEVLVNHKNVKTDSMTKFNLIKKKFNNGTLIDSLKRSKNVEVEKREENVEVEKREENVEVEKRKENVEVEKREENVEVEKREEKIEENVKVEKREENIEVEKREENVEVDVNQISCKNDDIIIQV
jgi:hypothetical protein